MRAIKLFLIISTVFYSSCNDYDYVVPSGSTTTDYGTEIKGDFEIKTSQHLVHSTVDYVEQEVVMNGRGDLYQIGSADIQLQHNQRIESGNTSINTGNLRLIGANGAEIHGKYGGYVYNESENEVQELHVNIIGGEKEFRNSWGHMKIKITPYYNNSLIADVSGRIFTEVNND